MKTSIKIAMVMMIATLFTAPVFAGDAKVGIGIGATEKGSEIYVPIKVPMASDHILIEPFIANSMDKVKVDGTTTLDTKGNELGVGLFYGKAMSDNVDLLLGARMAFVREETKTAVATTQKLDGFSFAPTIGVEYNINKHIAVGGYVDYAYTKTEDKPATTKTETESFKTGTNLFVKCYF
jgi:hypothetical protein